MIGTCRKTVLRLSRPMKDTCLDIDLTDVLTTGYQLSDAMQLSRPCRIIAQVLEMARSPEQNRTSSQMIRLPDIDVAYPWSGKRG
jgi:hypothetical protein